MEREKNQTQQNLNNTCRAHVDAVSKKRINRLKLCIVQ